MSRATDPNPELEPWDVAKGCGALAGVVLVCVAFLVLVGVALGFGWRIATR
jgi:hypothetical protein